MSIWKDFCRAVESKDARRHFGDLVSLVDSSAVFEFNQDQIRKAKSYKPDRDDDQPIPPFPFPRLCCIGPGGVILLQSPTMDDVGVLRYETIVWLTGRDGDHGDLIAALCTVDTTDRTEGGEWTITTTNLRSLASRGASSVYRDEDSPDPAADLEALKPVAMHEYARNRECAERCRQELLETQDPRRASELHDRLAELEKAGQWFTGLWGEYEKAQLSAREAAAELARCGALIIREALQLGLQEIQWINKPDHFTVEVAPLAPRRQGKTKKPRARRLADRTHYIVLTKTEIAEAWHRTHLGGTHASPLPHLRRGHYRTLAPSPNTDTTRRTWVRATHVNGKCVEWRDGDIRYRVV